MFHVSPFSTEGEKNFTGKKGAKTRLQTPPSLIIFLDRFCYRFQFIQTERFKIVACLYKWRVLRVAMSYSMSLVNSGTVSRSMVVPSAAKRAPHMDLPAANISL